MKVVLLGYMGSGKSVIGKVLADRLGVAFCDLDSYIEKKENATIDTIFSSKGELYFRKIEAVYLKELLEVEDSKIIAVGGGTPCYGDNLKFISEKSISVYLKASVATLFERLQNETAKRPLVAEVGEEQLPEFIAKHLFERTFFYDQAAIKIVTDNKSITRIADELVDLF